MVGWNTNYWCRSSALTCSCFKLILICCKVGDPTDPEVRPAFNALGYGGIYDQTHVGLPTLSADKMSVTIEYDSKIPDWEITGPGPAAVHALIHLAEGKTELQSAAANLAAKAKFEKAFYNYDTKLMKAAGKVWSEAYNITDINDSTNPLLLIGNGGYKIKSAVTGQSVTLVLNPKHVTNPSVQRQTELRPLSSALLAMEQLQRRRFVTKKSTYTMVSQPLMPFKS